MMWADDAAGIQLADELIACKKRGVDARALVDGVLASAKIIRLLRPQRIHGIEDPHPP